MYTPDKRGCHCASRNHVQREEEGSSGADRLDWRDTATEALLWGGLAVTAFVTVMIVWGWVYCLGGRI